ncbi:class I SAM-dependent methyltransferase [Anaerocolumna xylanovorans]|uniref:Methyltransferase domain-containing protein n=1 Tax=Anaerocolumna xylanovorans DSM 12503 TaxID=1121345 RepID=A0A1M7Y7W1_9FIRM|nr:class I SAM-dependent methyltransferase [Anaerocolumna xylanovorans]SHO48671.1 Methyltransferase domain-containing protein [Anaerocolumna xylanovorans DSM 12503]
MDTMDYLEAYYNNYDEEGRLLRRHGQVEYVTTMTYIHKFLPEEDKGNCRILEVGAGTGRYSIALAQAGYSVDSIELVEHNLNILKSKVKEGYRITARQGNALDLSGYGDETFDMTLVLGPMYHLYTEEDKKKALQEAIRVTKAKGYILVAYCMNEATILQYCFGKNQLRECISKNMLTEDFHCISRPEDLFEIVRTEDIKRLTEGMGVTRIHLIAADGAANYMQDVIDGMDDELYELYIRYHLSVCERQDLIGATNHSLDILRKEQMNENTGT